MIGSSRFPEMGPEGCVTVDADGTCHVNLAKWQERAGLFAPISKRNYAPLSQLSDRDKVLVNIRDPRDCMVSGYYGFLKLHRGGLSNPVNRTYFERGVDRYVQEVLLDSCREIFGQYRDFVRERLCPLL